MTKSDPSVTYKKGFKYLNGDDILFLSGVKIDAVPISELLSGWEALSRTKALRSNVIDVGASLLEELSTKIAMLETNIKSQSDLFKKNNKEDNAKIMKLQDEVSSQSNALDIMRNHCKSAAMKDVTQKKYIKSLKQDKKCLHDLINYQNVALNEYTGRKDWEKRF